MAAYAAARKGMEKIGEVTVPPREALCFRVSAGQFFRITSVEGSQVGDLNLWNAHDLSERFYSGKTRALHGTHLSTGDRMWSSFPNLRPMATITHDTLDWYGWDDWGLGIWLTRQSNGAILKPGQTYENLLANLGNAKNKGCTIDKKVTVCLTKKSGDRSYWVYRPKPKKIAYSVPSKFKVKKACTMLDKCKKIKKGKIRVGLEPLRLTK